MHCTCTVTKSLTECAKLVCVAALDTRGAAGGVCLLLLAASSQHEAHWLAVHAALFALTFWHTCVHLCARTHPPARMTTAHTAVGAVCEPKSRVSDKGHGSLERPCASGGRWLSGCFIGICCTLCIVEAAAAPHSFLDPELFGVFFARVGRVVGVVAKVAL